MKGGVILTDNWKTDPEGALFYFIENCKKVRILTDNSISCVTYVFYDLPSNITSPYVTVRSNNLNNPVNQILLKIGFISNTGSKQLIYCKRGLPIAQPGESKEGKDYYDGYIEIGTSEGLKKEVRIQHELFTKSFINVTSPFEPICPAIISYNDLITNDIKDRIFKNIYEKIQQRNGLGKKYDTSDLVVSQNLYNVNKSMSLIVMEFMDGFTPLSDLLNSSKKATYKIMHNYELSRMASLGYIHLDSHTGNVMINQDYPYFTADKDHKYYGRALIIDFGRAEEIDVKKINWVYNYSSRGQINSPEINTTLSNLRAIMAAQLIGKLSADQRNYFMESVRNHIISFKPIPQPKPKSTPQPKPKSTPQPKPKFTPQPKPKFTPQPMHQPTPEQKEQGLGRQFYMFATGTFPYESPVYSEWNLWDWGKIFGFFQDFQGFFQDKIPNQSPKFEYRQPTPEKNPTPKPEKNPTPKPEKNPTPIPEKNPTYKPEKKPTYKPEKNQTPKFEKNPTPKKEEPLSKEQENNKGCPSLSVTEVPKCMVKKGFRELSLKLHPDKNPNCNENDKKMAEENFKILNNNKAEQEKRYGDLSEESFNKCTKAMPQPIFQAKTEQKRKDQDYFNKAAAEQQREKERREREEREREEREREEKIEREKEREKEVYNKKKSEREKRERAEREKRERAEREREEKERAEREGEGEGERAQVQEIIDQYNRIGRDKVENINADFNNIIEKLYYILDFETKLFNYLSHVIKSYQPNAEAEYIPAINHVQDVVNDIEVLKTTIGLKINDLRQYMGTNITINGVILNVFQDEITINGLIDVSFRDYLIRIEDLNRAIFALEASITSNIRIIESNREQLNEFEKINKARLAEFQRDAKRHYAAQHNAYNAWFGIPQNVNRPIIGGNNSQIISITDDVKLNIFPNIPVFGIKYELAFLPLNDLISKYDLGELKISNSNLSPEKIKENTDNILSFPFSLNSLDGGKSLRNIRTHKKRIMKRRTMKYGK